jgi:hypothetical protein
MKYIITEDQYESITGNNIKRDVKYLDKVLNSKMFLDKYPCISMVSVDAYGYGIDLVMFINDSKKYWEVKDEIGRYIYSARQAGSVESKVYIYP